MIIYIIMQSRCSVISRIEVGIFLGRTWSPNEHFWEYSRSLQINVSRLKACSAVNLHVEKQKPPTSLVMDFSMFCIPFWLSEWRLQSSACWLMKAMGSKARSIYISSLNTLMKINSQQLLSSTEEALLSSKERQKI